MCKESTAQHRVFFLFCQLFARAVIGALSLFPFLFFTSALARVTVPDIPWHPVRRHRRDGPAVIDRGRFLFFGCGERFLSVSFLSFHTRSFPRSHGSRECGVPPLRRLPRFFGGAREHRCCANRSRGNDFGVSPRSQPSRSWYRRRATPDRSYRRL